MLEALQFFVGGQGEEFDEIVAQRDSLEERAV
jgi:hypothetical protein